LEADPNTCPASIGTLKASTRIYRGTKSLLQPWITIVLPKYKLYMTASG
jgi:hypothetical protein